jgi:transcription elongation factor GreA
MEVTVRVNTVYLTREGYEKLREELEYLQTVKRRELSAAIGKARDHGDISENAEYDAAKEEQGLNELRISKLEQHLSHVRIIDDEDLAADEILIGATVKLKNMDSGDELEYTLVSEIEADYDQGKISVSSPVGKGLIGHKAGEVLEIEVPVGILKYKVLEIYRK